MTVRLGVPEHFIEGKIGHGGGFAGLAFPKESPHARGVFNKFIQDGVLVGTARRFGGIHKFMGLRSSDGTAAQERSPTINFHMVRREALRAISGLDESIEN